MHQRVTAVIDTIDIDTIDNVTGIGNYVLIASHDHYSSESIRLGVRTQVVSCLHI